MAINQDKLRTFRIMEILMQETDEQFERMILKHDLDTVIILAHMNPDGDAAGSVMSLAHYIHMNYPKILVLPYLADTLDKGPKKLVAKDKVFHPFDKPKADRYGVIVCDTATKARMIGLEFYEQAVATIVIDHHAGNEGYGEVNNTKISEACAENIYYMLDGHCLKQAQQEESPTAADYIYLGIMHDTSGFSRAQTTTMQAAADLLSLGVDHKELMKTMQNDTLEDLEKQAWLLKNAKREFSGTVAYVIVDQKMLHEQNITYEDIHRISGILRDCEDIELGFTMYEEAPDIWRCSFRSDGKWIDVNELLKPLGGGGHKAAAGLRKETNDVKDLCRDIFKKIAELHPEVSSKYWLSNEGKYIGVDGCKGGWIVAILDDNDLRIEKYSTITDLITEYPVFDRLFIDMVIGLPSSTQDIRPDSTARKMLAPRTSTVFPVPCRQAVYAETEEKQTAENVLHLGKKLAKQSLAIIPKIRELDEFLNEHSEYKNVFRESHPELCFSRLAGEVLSTKKAEYTGYTQRQYIFSAYLSEIKDMNLWETAKELQCKPDDIVDALCLMVTAVFDEKEMTDTIPEEPQKDDCGFYMRMIIPKETES